MKQLSKRKVKERRKVGIIKAYMSRAAAIKKLQVPLADFRRLCILKGVYPVEPKNKGKITGGNTQRKTYFFTRDIQSLVEDPIVLKFWEFKVFMKRLTRAKGRHDLEKFTQVNDNKPIYKLDSVVKERYPRFIDALRDCDDALNMCGLFSMFSRTQGIPEDLLDLSKQSITDFENYVISTKSLRKVFISIKGYYYQAEIMGQTITWMIPHQFVIDRVSNVDLNVMKTFAEFYVTLLGFINYKLNKSIGVSNSADEQQLDVFEEIEGGETNERSVQQVLALERLFNGAKFFLNREVPRQSLTFVIKCFGGEVTDDDEDPTITHHIIDRDQVRERRLGRVYIQPQWVYDSVNSIILLPTADYLIGAKLPPHLSPFTNEKRGEYVPPDKIKLKKLREQFDAEDNGAVDEEVKAEEAEQDAIKKAAAAKKEAQNKSTKKSKMAVKQGKLIVENKEALKKEEDIEHRKLGIMMIPKKKKRLFDKITKTQKQRNRKTDKMRAKRRIVDAVAGREQKSIKKFAHKAAKAK